MVGVTFAIDHNNMLTFDARMAKMREGKRFVNSMWFLLISRETQVGVLELVLVQRQSGNEHVRARCCEL
jgi:hypothetical protein